MTEPAPQGLSCPGCGWPPALLMGGDDQAFCGNDDCHVFNWNPTMTLEQLADGATWIDLPDFLTPPPRKEDTDV